MAKRSGFLAILFTVLLVIACVAVLFAMFCINEMFVLLTTGGEFSLVYPAVSTVVVLLTFMAFAIVAGGAE